jgi:mono/diheme cytochrome c family protein
MIGKPLYALAAFGFLIPGAAIGAQKQADEVTAGRAYAEQVCAQCHAVRRGVRVSPNERATPFQVVSEGRGMSEMALRVWFQSPHPSMPNLVIRGRDADNLIAYILSLKP